MDLKIQKNCKQETLAISITKRHIQIELLIDNLDKRFIWNLWSNQQTWSHINCNYSNNQLHFLSVIALNSMTRMWLHRWHRFISRSIFIVAHLQLKWKSQPETRCKFHHLNIFFSLIIRLVFIWNHYCIVGFRGSIRLPFVVSLSRSLSVYKLYDLRSIRIEYGSLQFSRNCIYMHAIAVDESK